MPRLTRIVATVGPASSSPEMIEELIRTGVDVFRLNFSHGSYDFHSETLGAIRSTAARLGTPTVVLQDVSGPKLRIGAFAGGSVELNAGARFRLEMNLVEGTAEAVGFADEGWLEAVQHGERVLLGDGQVILKVIHRDAAGLDCIVQSGGVVRSKWGLNFPDSDIRLGAITPKDERDIAFGLKEGVDAIALSFVQGADDLKRARHLMKGHKSRPLLIAKIERPQALARIDAILAEADGLMVARGDLGITLPIEQIPTVQKRLIRLCRERGKIVITATQMLESMTSSPRPTRAEVTDVANAVYDGTDAVMLSGETAVGSDPVNVVSTMVRILEEAEPNAVFPPVPKIEASVESAMADAVSVLARDLRATAVLVPLTSGSTAARVSRLRVGAPVIAGAVNLESARRMQLRSGVYAFVSPGGRSFFQSVGAALEFALGKGWIKTGDRVVATGGFPLEKSGVTNFVRAITVGEEL